MGKDEHLFRVSVPGVPLVDPTEAAGTDVCFPGIQGAPCHRAATTMLSRGESP